MIPQSNNCFSMGSRSDTYLFANVSLSFLQSGAYFLQVKGIFLRGFTKKFLFFCRRSAVKWWFSHATCVPPLQVYNRSVAFLFDELWVVSYCKMVGKWISSFPEARGQFVIEATTSVRCSIPNSRFNACYNNYSASCSLSKCRWV